MFKKKIQIFAKKNPWFENNLKIKKDTKKKLHQKKI